MNNGIVETKKELYAEAFCVDSHLLWYNKSFIISNNNDEETVEARSIHKRNDSHKSVYQEGKSKTDTDTVNSNADKTKEDWRKITQNIIRDTENTPAGKCFVTARGWEDLSRIMLLFEKNNLSIDISLVEQYLQNPEISANFADYYNTYLSLGEIFKPEEILNGNASANLKEKVKNVSVSEKLGFLNLLTNRLFYICEQPNLKYKLLKEASTILRDKNVLISNIETAISLTDEILFSFTKKENNDSIYHYESKKSKAEKHLLYQMFLKIKSLLCNSDSDTKTIVSTYLKTETEHLTNLISETQAYLSNATDFICEVFGDSPEKQIFVSDMTLNKYSAEFLISFGCERFEKISQNKYSDKIILNEIENLI